MSKITALLHAICKNEYKNEYDLKKRYSNPKIFDGGGSLKVRWYVYYSYRPKPNGNLVRQAPIYLNINSWDNFRDRKKAAKTVQEAMSALLEADFNPYDANIDVESILKKLNITASKTTLEEGAKTFTISEAIKYALKIWESTLSENTYPDYKGRINQFEKWLIEHNHNEVCISKIRKRTVVDYLNDVLSRTSPKNRNNHRAVLSAFFGLLKEDEYADSNFVADIKVLSAPPKKNRTYTPTQEREILNYLFHNDKILDLFIKFISYNFLRPVEASRLRVMDIDVIGKKMRFKAKNQPVKTKIIPDILLKELPDLKNLNPSNYFFTPEGFGLDWDTAETNRRNYFGKRFKKVKEKFDLGEEYGLYSWRHTYITKLYYEFVRESTPFEAKSKLMLITGHSTMLALEKYLRDIDAVLPDDYSTALIKANEWLTKNPLPEDT
ncbi:site-specific integrase [Flavobacterium sp. WV_118_3]|uniref:tyrosine-type recombinase/integrase n=1 Tax=Flavobacterium sp. WV_118_3 TaxID=3151764 RepID=UPI00321A53C8